MWSCDDCSFSTNSENLRVEVLPIAYFILVEKIITASTSYKRFILLLALFVECMQPFNHVII